MKSMNFIIGQESKLESSASTSSRWHKGNTTYKAAYLADDDDDGEEDSLSFGMMIMHTTAMIITSTPRKSTTMTLKRRWTSPTPTPSTTLRRHFCVLCRSQAPAQQASHFKGILPSGCNGSEPHQRWKRRQVWGQVESPWQGQRKELWERPTSEGFGKVSCRSCPWKIAVLALCPVKSPSKRLSS